MSKTDGDNEAEPRRSAFWEWMEEEGNAFIGTLGEKHRRLAEHVLWNAFKAGERHGRAQLDAILDNRRNQMSYRIRFTLPHGSTGHLAREYATREEAQRAIDDRQKETGFAYVVEEVVATAAVPDASPEAATPEARIREMEAELAQLREAYDAARHDLDLDKRNVARLESTLGMVQAAWAASVASADVARAASAEAHRKAVVSVVRLDRALALGDAMHRAMTEAPIYIHGTWWGPINRALEEWAAYKYALAASRQGPAKASDEPGEVHHSGEGEK